MNKLGVLTKSGVNITDHIRSYHAMFPEDVPKGPWDDAPVFLGLCRAHHGVGLSCTSLAVGENGAVVAIHDTLDHWTLAADACDIFRHILTQWYSFLCAKCN